MDWNEHLDSLATGYRHAAILLAASQTGLFDALGDAWREPAEVAGELGLDERALDVVMHALVGAGVLLQRDDEFSTVPEARPLLRRDSSETMASMLGHHLSLMKRWSTLEDILRTGQAAPRGERTERDMRNFICGMENISRRSSLEVAGRIDLSGARLLLDLGGGPGTAALTFARANPDLHCVVFDLPGPVGIAREQIAASGLDDRVTVREGDFFADDLGEGYDVIYVSNIIHSLGNDETRALLRKCRRALLTGGRVMIKDFYLEDSRSEPAWGALFSVNMLVSTEAGKSYPRAEIMALLAETGFGDFEIVDVARNSQVISGAAVVD